LFVFKLLFVVSKNCVVVSEGRRRGRGREIEGKRGRGGVGRRERV